MTKPGIPKQPLPEVTVPKWHGAPKKAGKPIDPDHPPVREPPPDTHYVVHPGVTMAKPLQLPNQRGKGGRPTNAQKDAANPTTGARNAIDNVREETPPLRLSEARGKTWESEYDKAEKEIERKEATALLLARRERLEAIQEETMIRQANRRLATGFGAVGIQAISVLSTTIGEINTRVKDKEKLNKMSLKELNAIINATGSITNKAQQAIESMARAERYILRHPLEDGVSEDDDLEGMTSDDAMVILQNLTKSLTAVAKITKNNPEVVSTQENEVPDEH